MKNNNIYKTQLETKRKKIVDKFQFVEILNNFYSIAQVCYVKIWRPRGIFLRFLTFLR